MIKGYSQSPSVFNSHDIKIMIPTAQPIPKAMYKFMATYYHTIHGHVKMMVT
jgi:hypothetical protein